MDEMTEGTRNATQSKPPVALVLTLLLIFTVSLTAVLLWGLPKGSDSEQANIESPDLAAPVQQSQAVPKQPEKPLAPEDILGNSAGKEEIVQLKIPGSYKIEANFGDIGPQLLEAGAIDYERFVELYEGTGRPLTPAQQAFLTEGSEEPVVIDFENAHFLLNFLWAFGLTNQNTILTEGPMIAASEGDIGRFASTGGWTLGSYPSTTLYASMPMVILTADQQSRLENVANNVYRPCCNNHTAFADCNHGMAMLGLLELLASQGASEDEMYATAKAVNAFWYPQQAVETAVFFKTAMNLDYDDVEPRMAVGRDVFSGTGFRQVHQWLAENNLLEPAPNSGGSCGVG